MSIFTGAPNKSRVGTKSDVVHCGNTSTLHRHSFGIIMLCLGLLATTPVGSTVPGLILAVIAVQLIVGRAEPVFPHFRTQNLPLHADVLRDIDELLHSSDVRDG
jgi:hypothetical protein